MPALLTILGSNAAVPTRTRFHSAQHLLFMEDQVLIDCGEGTQNRLLEYTINFQKINHVFISHLHGDHYLGLPGLLNTMSLNQRTKPINIYGPAGLKKLLNLHFELGEARFSFEIHIEELTPNQLVSLNSMDVRVIPVFHRISCYSFLFREKKQRRKLNIEACRKYQVPQESFSAIKNGDDYQNPDGSIIENRVLTTDPPPPFSYGYITDTLYKEALTTQFQNVKVLYHEATYLNSLMDRAIMTYHSTAGQAAEFASKCSANQLIIGHFSSRYIDLEGHLSEARQIFPNTDLAMEGQTFELS